VFGNALHLVVEQADAAVPQVKKYLGDQGVTVRRIEKIHPSLEDVFVSLTTEPRNGKGPKAS
jgi:ABC-2 type transport system ATP-binding protein